MRCWWSTVPDTLNSPAAPTPEVCYNILSCPCCPPGGSSSSCSRRRVDQGLDVRELKPYAPALMAVVRHGAHCPSHAPAPPIPALAAGVLCRPVPCRADERVFIREQLRAHLCLQRPVEESRGTDRECDATDNPRHVALAHG
eukprot:scaffold2952_cov312-Pinguiococcus_pyrenoidosus.AAC.27